LNEMLIFSAFDQKQINLAYNLWYLQNKNQKYKYHF
jgi:hypothetical protein